MNAQYTMHVINAHLGHFNLKAPNVGGGWWAPGRLGRTSKALGFCEDFAKFETQFANARASATLREICPLSEDSL